MTEGRAGDGRRQLLLCSGGFDSISLLILQRSLGIEVSALFFDYGQLNKHEELASARHFCELFDAPLSVAALAGAFPDSGLTDEAFIGAYLPGKSRFFLPMRNAVFIAIGVSWALKLGCSTILTGSVFADRTHLDSGEEFEERVRELVLQCSDGAVSVEFPLAKQRKAEVLERVAALTDPRALLDRTYSCYFPRTSGKVRRFAWGDGCGSCLSCRGRRAAFGGEEG
jgi:7-cyano-7-deazaguanine synthase